MLHKKSLLIIFLALSGCALFQIFPGLPDPPEVWQCGHSVKFNKFRCVNTKTGEALNVSRNSPSMEGAQCLAPDDFQASQRYLDQLLKVAKERCK
jgi:hypothetical protein